MTLYADSEGSYLQKLPFSMKRKTLIAILERARRDRLQSNAQKKIYLGTINCVLIHIDGEPHRIASVIFSNGTRWDYTNGVTIQKRSKSGKRYWKIFVKYCKQFTLEERIAIEQERQRIMMDTLTKALETGWKTKVTV